MAYVTRYIYGTDKLRPNAFEVRGLNGVTSGVIHCDELAILSQWLKLITDNVVGLTHLQVSEEQEPRKYIIFPVYFCQSLATDEALQSKLCRRRAHRVYGLGERGRH